MPCLKNKTTGQIIAEKVRYADSFWERFAGFIPRAQIDPDEGLWFRDCWAIHTLCMRAMIDVIFLDASGRVVRKQCSVPRQRLAIACPGARDVIELGTGALDSRDILVGDRLELE